MTLFHSTTFCVSEYNSTIINTILILPIVPKHNLGADTESTLLISYYKYELLYNSFYLLKTE